MTRIHIALSVTDLDRSVGFYRDLFGIEPEHHRPDHAKFAPLEPPVNFTLNPGSPATGAASSLSHLGVEVMGPDALDQARKRMQAAGHAIEEEHQVECCYARQDKFWVEDPDGHRWEFFLVHEHDVGSRAAPRSGSCCS